MHTLGLLTCGFGFVICSLAYYAVTDHGKNDGGYCCAKFLGPGLSSHHNRATELYHHEHNSLFDRSRDRPSSIAEKRNLIASIATPLTQLSIRTYASRGRGLLAYPSDEMGSGPLPENGHIRVPRTRTRVSSNACCRNVS
jgi:hypothetical protein